MNHYKVSLIKSIIRIAGTIVGLACACIGLVFLNEGNMTETALNYCLFGLTFIASTFFTAELLGIIEEKVDRRKEE